MPPDRLLVVRKERERVDWRTAIDIKMKSTCICVMPFTDSMRSEGGSEEEADRLFDGRSRMAAKECAS